MKKPATVTVVIGSVLVIVAIAYYILSVNRVNTQCMNSLDPLSLAIYEYRDANGNWPESILTFPDDMKKTTRGVPIIYDRDSLLLTAECAHPGIPLFDRLDYRPYGTNFHRTSSHAMSLEIGYQRWKEEAAYERWKKVEQEN